MKKLITLVTVCTAFLNGLKSQNMVWDTVEAGNFGLSGFELKDIEVYNNSIYIGGGKPTTNGASILVSSNGNAGTFAADAGFSALTLGNEYYYAQCLKKSPVGNFLFAGIMSYADDPRVFRFDGSTWLDFGQIPYVVGDSSYYDGITAMGYFTTSGTNDSLYVALRIGNNGISAGIGPQIYRTSIYNPSWQFVDSIPAGYYNITDFESFNSGFYFGTSGLPSVFGSSTGTNFTTVSDTGFFDNSAVYSINDLQTYAGELYVTTSRSDSNIVFKTANGTTWNEAGPRAFNSIHQCQSASDMEIHNGKLWITAYENQSASYFLQQNQTPGVMASVFVPIVYSWNGGAYTLESPYTLGNTNDQMPINIKYLPAANKMFVGERNFGYGNSLYNGCFPPVVSFSDNMPYDSTCLYNAVYLFGNSSGEESVSWFDNGTYINSGDTIMTSFTSTGGHFITFVGYNGGCADSVYWPYYVKPQFLMDSVSNDNVPVCFGLDDTLTAWPNLATGTPPFTYNWTDGGPSIGTTQTIFIPAVTTHSIGVSATDLNGCYAWIGPTINVTPPTDIVGSVNYSLGAVTSGNVYLIKIGTSSAGYDTVSMAPITGGYYSFSNFAAGNYYARAEVPSDPTLVNTYYGNEYLWDSALAVPHGCTVADSGNIMMIELPGITGPGSVHGTVYEGVGFGQKLIAGPVGVMTNVIPGVPVKIGKNPGGAIVQATTTDASGQYDFTNLPYDSYKIYTDIPGYPMDSSYAVVLSASTDSLVDLDYFVDSNSVYIDLTTTIHSISKNQTATVFPNPSNGKITVKFDQDQPAEIIQLFDLSGRMVHSVKIPANTTLFQMDLSGYEIFSGTYILNLKNTGQKFKISFIRN